jgi:hypothetical protein
VGTSYTRHATHRAGDILQWDDEAIKVLNPALAEKLPAVNITLGYSDNTVISVPEVFKLALSSFSARFAEELAASPGRNFSNMPPALRGTGINAGSSSLTRANWLKVTTTQKTFLLARLLIVSP